MRKYFFILSLPAAIILADISYAAPLLPQKVAKTEKTETPEAAKEEKKPPAPKEKAFEDVIKEAVKLEGLFNLYKKDDRLYMEILPEQFGRMHLFVPTQWTSIGFGGAGRYLDDRVFVWEKLDKKVLLVWKNTRFVVKKSQEYRRSLKNVVPDSIVHVFEVESAPHPEKKSVLIVLDDCFFSDLTHLGSRYSSPKNPYSMDKRRTVWGKIQSFPQNVELEVRYTLASSKPQYIASVPDSRVFTVKIRYSISELPVNNGYKSRLADDRVGYFHTLVYDFDRQGLEGTAVRYINRWNLEKRNPRAKVSEPKQPIVFWLENTIPLRYRDAIRDGILEWNKAYERAGFKNAIVVKQMPDDAEWDPADIRYNTIRWVASLTGYGGGAFGPSRVNPFTGQILDADVVMYAPVNRIFRYKSFESPLDSYLYDSDGISAPGFENPWHQDNVLLGYERDFGILDMLVSGKISTLDEVPEEYMYDYFKFLACHEVGHTLGLRHNFKGSLTIAMQDLHNPKVTTRESIGNSIMEYLPANTAPKGVKQGEYWQTTIGAWDYWVIEYGYIPIKARTPDDELPFLSKIASRSNEPELIYGTDEDAFSFGPYAYSIDPLCVTFDIGDDPMAYTLQRINRIKDLWKLLEKRVLFEGKSYQYLRQAFDYSLGWYITDLGRLPKWIGGIYHVRAHVGDPGKSLPFEVVETEKQEQAFDIIRKNLLQPDTFSFDPAFLNKLQVGRYMDDFGEIMRLARSGRIRMDYSLVSRLKGYYQNILGQLLDPMRMHRILDNEMRSTGEKFTLDSYLGKLDEAVWQELEDKESIGTYRRVLQREYINRVKGCILNPSAAAPDDVSTICRYLLKKLDKKIQEYMSTHANLDLATRAHLDNCSDLIDEALKAVYVKNVK